MLKNVLFLSLTEMKRRKPSLDTVVVSILDNSESGGRPRLGGFRSVLSLEFEDTFEEMKLAKAGDWPDEPNDDEHARFAQGRGERVPALSDARAIVEFLHRCHQTPETLTLVVHCHGGISRSAAVATWAAARFWAPLLTSRSTDRANARLMRLLDKADGRR